MPDLIKQAGIKQADGTYEMKDIGVDYENVDGLSTEATSFKAVNDKNEKDITTYIAGASKEDENLILTDGAGSTSSVDLSMTGATANENGEAGFVPAPTAADRTKYLKGDGTWAEPVNEDINVEVPWYGVCASAATAATKVVSTTSGNFELSNGAKVVVKFNNGNTSDSVLSLNVDNTGATPIKLFDNNTNNLRDYKINANDIIEFVYTGNYFVAMPSMSELSHMQDDRVWSATCPTSAASSAKFATTTVNGNNTAGFSLITGVKVRVKFTYANTALTPTLSVNGSTDKNIKAFGTTAPGFWWKAGDVVDFTYDGTNWIMSPSSGQLDKIGESIGFIGTRAEINEAMAAGAIPDGMLVYCTDDLTGFPVNADDVIYDNAESGLAATNVQDAIDEVENVLDGLSDNITDITSDLGDKTTASSVTGNDAFGKIKTLNDRLNANVIDVSSKFSVSSAFSSRSLIATIYNKRLLVITLALYISAGLPTAEDSQIITIDNDLYSLINNYPQCVWGNVDGGDFFSVRLAKGGTRGLVYTNRKSTFKYLNGVLMFNLTSDYTPS